MFRNKKMGNYEAVIGLEVHVHLATESKLFCSCSTRFGASPNSNVCEICSGMPGALPSPNKEAIRLAAILGLSVNCHINTRSVFARKNYFYPDLPSGYQISQYETPVCENGFLEIETVAGKKKIGITRIHMENDAGKNIHSGIENLSFVDLNRAGDPLVEIVSEPDLSSGEEAVKYLKLLHNLVTYLGISDGNMEEGSFRCDANVSIRPRGETALGTRTELKNLNSFRNVQRAIDYEIERQEELLESGEKIIQETRLYDADKNLTRSMRTKEEAEDYRYFPDPDLLPVEITEAELVKWKSDLPELPQARVSRFRQMTGLPEAEAEMLAQNQPLANFFEEAAQKADPRKTANFILGPAARYCNERNLALSPENWKMNPANLAALVNLQEQGTISAKIAAEIFPQIFESGENPENYIRKKGLAQMSGVAEMKEIVQNVLSANPAEVEAYKNGKEKLISFFMGQIMKATKGKANPEIVNKLLKENLKK